MKSDTLILAAALDALSRLYPTDSETLREAASRLRELKAENQRLVTSILKMPDRIKAEADRRGL